MNNKYIIGVVLAILLIGGLFFLNQAGINQQSSSSNNKISSGELIPVDSITHGHGLAVDIADSNKIYIATHHGLLLLVNGKELYQIGESKDDYMGFSPHPTDPKIFFSSGHPETGCNIGFQKSKNGGKNWEIVSNTNVPIVSLVASPKDENVVYAASPQGLMVSKNQGKDWNSLLSGFVSTVAINSQYSQKLISFSEKLKLAKSSDGGKN